jgi:dTDP-4-dehydrorhamnose reductase
MTSREHAEELVKYFDRLSKRHPKDEEYSLGLTLAERWLALIDAPKPDPVLVAALLKDVDTAEAREDAGSGIADLSLSAHAWARAQKA